MHRMRPLKTSINMKKLCLIIALFASLTLDAQYVTTSAKNAQSQNEGIFYYLPRNVIKLELTVEETGYYIGPYAEFASEMLGTTDYIKENKTEVNIKNIDIQLGSEIDPNMAFFVEFDEKSKEPLPNFNIDQDGIIMAVGYENIPAEPSLCRNTFDYKDMEYRESTPVSFIEILDIQEDEDEDEEDEEEGGNVKKAPKRMTKEDKAKVALENIDKIRTAQFDLVSGVQEVNFGSTMTIMVDNMKAIENEYISLFKGKVVKNTYKVCFYVTPEKNQANNAVWVGKLDNGETIKIQFDTKNTAASINALDNDVLNANQTNKLFYRMPSLTTAKVTLGSETIASRVLTISQFGELRLVSTKNNKILFNPNTGQVITVSK